MTRLSMVLSLALILIGLPVIAQPGTWYVDDLSDGRTGIGSEIDPFRDLQAAIDSASDGDRLLLMPGTYEAHPDFYPEELCGNCEEHRTYVKATRGFLVKGKALEIVGSGIDSTILITKAGYGVLFEHSRGSIITNLTITGGLRDLDGMATDAGVVAKFSTVTVKKVKISDNTHRPEEVVVGIGGVFGRENSELFILDNIIENNGWDGVALYRGANAYIADNVICEGRGAGVGITWDATATAYRNLVSGYWKGIGTFGDSRAVVRNNAVYDNLGWGIIATGNSFMEASNNVITRNGNCGFAPWSETARGTFVNNIVTENGWRKEWVCPCVGIWMYGKPENFVMSHNIVWGNQEGDYRDMEDLTGRDGNISSDPLFRGKIDFRLMPGSPAFDSGDSVFTDPDGGPSDMGIYGGPGARWVEDYEALLDDTSLIELVAVGDVMLARGVNRRILEEGPNFPFEKTRWITSLADIAFCNLEGAISPRATRNFKNNRFCIKPEEAKGLSFAGFDVVSLANNHMFDCEKKGIVSTIDFLEQEQIKFTGAGKTPAQALRPAILDLKSTRIGFLAYNAYPMDWIVLKKDQPAIAFYDSNRAVKAIEKLKKKADVVIVSLHWGDEYRKKPNHRQVKIAHRLIDAGADLILGHHPHVLQPIEEYNDGVIVYSLGNFVFDQRRAQTKKSMIFKAKISRNGVDEYTTIPAQITDHRPCQVKEKVGEKEVAADLSTDETD
ncbi:MAG: CapA family protein [Candidatus Zixiibacteriota bacterium]|nr:MAG: CapA family protein [candidate division Zixibacteria bacterium]